MSEKDDVLTLEKAQSKLAEYEAKMVEIEKAAQAELEKATARIVELEKAEEARIMKAFEAKVETYSFVSEDERVELAKTLREVDSKQLIDILDKAQAAIQAALGEGTKGASVKEQESVDLNKSKKEGVAALLMKQFPQEV